MIACKQKTVDFNFSPTEPRAGEAVHFSNISSDGEEWMWDFGDGSSSTLRSPAHTFRRADTYMVTLKVDGKAMLTRTKKVVVVDTIPNFVLTDTTQQEIYRTLTLRAQHYNPYNYAVQYRWSVSGLDFVAISETDQAKEYQVYFTQAGRATVQLQVIIEGDTTTIQHDYTIASRPAPVVLMQTAQGAFGQRIFGALAAQPQAAWYADAQALLDAHDETTQTYNGHLFTLAELNIYLPDIQGFYVINRRVYYRTSDAFYVANLEGGNRVCISSQPVSTLAVDPSCNRIYWAEADGVRYMPLVGSENNRFDSDRIQSLNTLTGIQRLAIDTELR